MSNLPTIRQIAPSGANPNAAGVGIGDQFFDPLGVEAPAAVQGPAGAQVLLPLTGGGGVSYTTVNTVGPYLAVKGDVVFVDAGAGAAVVTLPTVVGPAVPILVTKVDATANVVTVACFGGETINGAATFVLTAMSEAITLHPNAGASRWGVF